MVGKWGMLWWAGKIGGTRGLGAADWAVEHKATGSDTGDYVDMEDAGGLEKLGMLWSLGYWLCCEW